MALDRRLVALTGADPDHAVDRGDPDLAVADPAGLRGLDDDVGHVGDVAASLATAQELGAAVAIPLIDNGDITFAHLVDPDGNRFAIWRRNAE